MSKIDLTQFAGMVTAPGLLERNEASCLDALNFEFPAPGIIRKRRGMRRLAGNAGGPVWKLFTSRLMGSSLLAHVGTAAGGTQLRAGDGTIALAAVATVDAGNLTRSRETRMQMAMCQRNHYLTATEGVARVESDVITALSGARYAGMPRGVGPTLWTLVAGTNLGDGYARAYRVTWHRKDADGVELGGAPTSRFVVANAVYNTGWVSATARHVSLQIHLPKEVGTLNTALNTSYYWRLWGTRTYREASETGDDEMHLISEAFVTATDIANGYFAYTDSTPDAFLLSSPALHTNLNNYPASEAGIRQGVANEDAPPPTCNDLAYWQDVLWYADCSTRPSITVGLIAALTDGDTVTVTSNGVAVTITARTTPATSTEFLIVTTAASVSLNIRQTVTHMLRILHANSVVNGVTSHQPSTTTTQPGLVYLELSRPGAAPLVFNSSVPGKWQGFNGYAISGNATSVAESNVLRFSKPLRGDAVPPVNRLTAGPADSRILRIAPLRDRLYVFTDYGIYVVTGRTFADFSVFPFDLGYRLMGREYVAQCDEKLYAWCNEGIIEIDEGGVRVISTPIEPTLEAAQVKVGGDTSLSAGRAVFAALGYATAYRNQHQVRFHYPETDTAASVNGCAYWLSFDTRTRAWSRGRFAPLEASGFYENRSCGVVRFADDLLAWGNWSSGADTYLHLEQRFYKQSDFRDAAAVGGATTPIPSSLTLQWQVPDASGDQHWQQTAINWDAEEIAWRPLPSSVSVQHSTEQVVAAAQSIAVGELVTRIEPPMDARRGQRMAVTISHDLEEYAGIVGISQSYRSGSRFARKVTP